MTKRIDEKHPGSNTITIDELWENLADFCYRRVEENKKCDEYPFEVRIRQLNNLKVFIRKIEEHHKKFNY